MVYIHNRSLKILFFIIFSLFLVTSCSLFNSSYEEKSNKITVSGTFEYPNDTLKEFVQSKMQNQSLTRSLLPDNFDSSTIQFELTANKLDEQGTIIETQLVEIQNSSFSIEGLENGVWLFKLTGYILGEEDTKNIILEGSKQLELNSGEIYQNVKIPISLSIQQGSTSNINFTFGVDNDLSSVTFSIMFYNAQTMEPTSYMGSVYCISNNESSYKLEINSGIYKIIINAILDCGNNTGVPIRYSDWIIALPGQTISKISDTSPLCDPNGKIFLTKDVIKSNFSGIKSFYVDTNNTGDNHLGTYFDPFTSVKQAVYIINLINDETSQYEILLKNNIIDNSADSSSYVEDSFISIIPEKSLNLTIKSNISGTKRTINIKRDDTKKGRIIYAKGKNTGILNLTLQDLILTGGYFSNEKDAGALDAQYCNLNIYNCEFNNNISTSSGGAIIIRDNAKIYCEGSEFSSNKTKFKYFSNGGAVYLYKNSSPGAINKFIGCTFKSNNTDLNDEENPDAADNARGGAIFNKSNLILYNCIFTDNSTITVVKTEVYASSGGAIYNGSDGKLLIKNCEFTGNKTFSGKSPSYNGSGGAIYNASPNCVIMDSQFIGNNSYNRGGAIYSTGDIKIMGCIFKKNAAGFTGGAIYMENGSLYINKPDVNLKDIFSPDTDVPESYTINTTIFIDNTAKRLVGITQTDGTIENLKNAIFLCPKIKLYSYNNVVYNNIKRDFSNLYNKDDNDIYCYSDSYIYIAQETSLDESCYEYPNVYCKLFIQYNEIFLDEFKINSNNTAIVKNIIFGYIYSPGDHPGKTYKFNQFGEAKDCEEFTIP